MVIPMETLVQDWLDAQLGVSQKFYTYNERKLRRLWADRSDLLYSYGAHFPLLRVLRYKSGKVRGFLLNGDRWARSGGSWSMTAEHQSAVLRVVTATGLPFVTIPWSALDSSGLDTATVHTVHRTSDTWETKVHDFNEPPAGAAWRYDQPRYYMGAEHWLPGSKGVLIHKTGEFIESQDWSQAEAPGKPTMPNGWYSEPLEVRTRMNEEYTRETQRWQLTWERYVGVQKETGRKRLYLNRYAYAPELELYEHEDGTVHYRYTTQRHWLGESLIRAQVPYRAKNGTRRRRWAYFLSGFDSNEARPSYFFTELPPGVKPTTVAEAYDTLKPKVVALAEEMGREVQRQGDIYWVPMPDLTLRDLKQQGGVHRHRGGTHLVDVKNSRREFVAPRLDNVHVLSTNHTATDVVTVGPLTYARGILRHEPSFRRPDHARIKLGDRKTWGLVLKNMTPTT